MDHVEEVGGEPAATTRCRLGTEVAHRVLEPTWTAVLGQPGHLAIENEIACGQPGDERHDTGEPVGDVVEVAGEQADLAGAAVCLYTGAIELPLDGRLAGLGKCVGDVVRRRGQHRPDRPPRFERDRPQRLDAAGERLAGGLAEIAGEHVGAADLVDRCTGSAGDGVDHHPIERTLAQLAAEHAPQQPLLDGRRAGEHADQQVAPPTGRARPRLRGKVAEPPVDLEHLERRLVGVAGVELAQRRPPDPDAPLAWLAGEQPDGDRRLLGRHRPQQGGEQRRLLAPFGGRRDLLGDGGQLDEPHNGKHLHGCERRGASDEERPAQRPAWLGNADSRTAP